MGCENNFGGQGCHSAPTGVVDAYNWFPQELDSEQELNSLLNNIRKWHCDRNLIDGSTDAAQFKKLQEEVNELKSSIEQKTDVSDDIGDIIVVLVNIATRNNLSIRSCLQRAWNDIKDRKGKMVDGIFVKETSV